jgi:hypothetical protein
LDGVMGGEIRLTLRSLDASNIPSVVDRVETKASVTRAWSIPVM